MSAAVDYPASDLARRRWAWCILLGVLLTAAATVIGAWAVHRGASIVSLDTATVSRGDVIASIEAEGNVESAHNVEISCQVDGGSTILWIIPDGTQVTEGDELVRFDSSAVEDQLSQQTIVVERAKAAQIAAEHELAAARLALPEYVDGTFVELNEEAGAAIAKAEHDLQLARRMLAATRRLLQFGYATPTQLEANVFGADQAELQVGIARRTKTVLETFHRPKMTQDLQSRLETAEALVRSTTAEYELAQSLLSRCHRQLDKCLVRAPHSGLAIHANEPGRSSGEALQIELGALVRARQAVIWLPDLSTMQVSSLVHESSVMRVHPGQRASVRVRGRDLPAVVTAVANQPAPTRRSQQHLKYFVVSALIEERSPGLRPGETADLTVLLDYRADVLRAPLQTVVKQEDGVLVWVDHEGAVEPRRIEVGAFGDRMAEIRGGLSEGERLVLNPREKLLQLEGVDETQRLRDRRRFDKSASASTDRGGRHGAAHAAGG
jgi:HlyD family secretion protein